MPNAICAGSWAAVADQVVPARPGNRCQPSCVRNNRGVFSLRVARTLTTAHGAELVSTLIDRGRRSEPRFRVTSLNRSEKQQLLTLTSTHSLPN